MPLVRLFQRSQRVEAAGAREPLPQVRAVRALWQALIQDPDQDPDQNHDQDPDRPARSLRLLRRDEGGDEVLVVCGGELPGDVTSLAQALRLAPRRPLPCVLPVELLSHTERAVLALAAALCTRDVAPELVLLDEPERHLPPDRQARLLPALRAALPQAQLLVASHAEPIAASVLAYERLTLPAPPSLPSPPSPDRAATDPGLGTPRMPRIQ